MKLDLPLLWSGLVHSALSIFLLLPAAGQWQPYAPGEVAKMKAFLELPSMVPGKTNAQAMGATLSNPATWTGIGWTYHDPDTFEELSEQHIVAIDLQGSYAGSANFGGLPYLGFCAVDNSRGSVGHRGDYPNINISGNPRLTGIYLNYVSADTLTITGNSSLRDVTFVTTGIGNLTLSASGLLSLRASSLGSPPISLSAFPSLEILDLYEIDNISSLNLALFPNLEVVRLNWLGTLQSVTFGGMAHLEGATISHNAQLAGVDVRGGPELRSLYCSGNPAMTNLQVGANPKLGYVEIGSNPALTTLSLANLPALAAVRCSSNPNLASLSLCGDPLLAFAICQSNALTSLQFAGSDALDTLLLTGNKLKRFDQPGLSLKELSLNLNELEFISTRVGGRSIQVLVHGGGGYVGIHASPDSENPDKTFLSFGTTDFPEPRNTRIDRIEGPGVPEGDGWQDRFEVTADINAIAYFTAGVIMYDYFERPEDNPLGEWFGRAKVFASIVGDLLPDPATAIPVPKNTGFAVEGWYTDEPLTEFWDFSTRRLEGEIELYPNWLSLGAPHVLSVKRLTPASAYSGGSTITWLVTFSEDVIQIDIDDFALTATGTAGGTILSVSAASGSAVSVTVGNLSGSGTLRLDVNGGPGIVDLTAYALTNDFTRGETYTIGAAGALGEFLLDHGIDPQTPAGQAGADADGDGVANSLEFVLGGDPQNRNSDILPDGQHVMIGNTPFFQFSYQTTNSAGTHYDIITEYSANLANWQPAANGQNGVDISMTPTADGQRVTVRVPATAPKLSARLRATPK